MKRLTSIFALVVLFLILSSPSPTYAQAENERIDLTVSPVFLDYTTEPGKEIKDKIRLRNNSDSPINLKIEIKKLTASDVREANLEDPKPEDTFVSWVKLEKDQFTASPQEWTEIPFSIAVPADAAFGYYLALTVSQDSANNQINQPTAVIQGAVAVPVLLKVSSPNTKAEAELVEFKPKRFINEYLPVEFDVKFKNSGNVHIKPRGNIFIRGTSDKDLAILEVNEGMGTVLPQGSRVYTSAWDDGFIVWEKDESTKELKYKLKFNWDKLTDFRIGPYTASLLMVYDDGVRDVTLESKTTFWVFPYTIVGGLIVTLIVLGFLIKFMLNAYVKSQVKKYRH